MSLTNYTPFLAVTWETTAPSSQPYMSAVCRIKYKLVSENERGVWSLVPDPDQGDLFDEDIFYDDDAQIRYPSDYVPYKPNADIIINGVARASTPQQTWVCNVSLLSPTNQLLLDKSLRVWGERFWNAQAITGFWRLDSEAKPTTKVSIRYEFAYGGEIEITNGENKTLLAREERNPIGCGILHKKQTLKSTRAPQIEALDDPIQKPYHPYTPQGFGAINRTWEQRFSLSGTYDDDWLEHVHPLLPRDFDEHFYQCAHPDMVVQGYIPKSSKIQLTNLLQGDPIQSISLPSIDLFVRFSMNSSTVDAQMNIDTLLLDIESDENSDHRVYITWRYRYPIDEEILLSAIYLKEDQPKEEYHG